MGTQNKSRTDSQTKQKLQTPFSAPVPVLSPSPPAAGEPHRFVITLSKPSSRCFSSRAVFCEPSRPAAGDANPLPASKLFPAPAFPPRLDEDGGLYSQNNPLLQEQTHMVSCERSDVIFRLPMEKPGLGLGARSGAAPRAEHPQEQTWSSGEHQNQAAGDPACPRQAMAAQPRGKRRREGTGWTRKNHHPHTCSRERRHLALNGRGG